MYIVTSVQEVVSKQVPATRPSPYAKRWFSPDLKMQQLEVNRLRRKWQERCASSGRTDVKAMQLFTEMHNKRREWTRAIEKAKASHWKDFLDRDIRENLACGKMIRLTYALLEKGYKISEYNIEEISLGKYLLIIGIN